VYGLSKTAGSFEGVISCGYGPFWSLAEVTFFSSVFIAGYIASCATHAFITSITKGLKYISSNKSSDFVNGGACKILAANFKCQSRW